MVTCTLHIGQTTRSPAVWVLRDPCVQASIAALPTPLSLRIILWYTVQSGLLIMETVLQLLNATGPLQTLFSLQLPLEVWPWMTDVQLMWGHDASGGSDPIIQIFSIPAHVHQIGLKRSHWTSNHHPGICRRPESSPRDSPCRPEFPEFTLLGYRPCLNQLMHCFQLPFNNGVLGVLQLCMLIKHNVNTTTFLETAMSGKLMSQSAEALWCNPLSP